MGELLFGGRINRAAYWLWSLAICVGFGIIAGLLVVPAANGASPIAIAVIALLLGIPAMVACFGIAVKRLHDRDKSAWWLAVFYGVPTLFQLAAIPLGTSPAALPLLLAGAAISLWAFVELGFLRGTDGFNQFGRDPLQG